MEVVGGQPQLTLLVDMLANHSWTQYTMCLEFSLMSLLLTGASLYRLRS